MEQRNNLLRAILLMNISNDIDEEEDGSRAAAADTADNYFPASRINVDKWRQLGDPQFKKHFRMNRITFEKLVVVVGNQMAATNRLQKKGIPVDIALCMTLHSGQQFNCSGGSIHNQYRTVIAVLREVRDRFIQWPSDQEKEVISAEFENAHGYPSTIGCIDGCHIRVTKPIEQGQMYTNRHHDYSILLQAVCDNRILFCDVYVGEPGSVSDAGVFHRSPLSRHILQPDGSVGDFHLLGDGAYPCTKQFLVPYRDHGNLTQEQRFHNYTLSRCRASIERAFGLLKGKSRRLKFFPSFCLEYAVDHIMACLVLHNFLILEGEDLEIVENHPFEWQPGEYQRLLNLSKEKGVRKRDYIATMLVHG
ncbi:Putative nuclease [Frankliniella fusca]|uniref:Nuclease n=1 Tax=Frankliniella fusca TaxID=407009 RepID=A0AAE1H9R1_9NEOP|nr:Putative nuclease [Frankliniella fusca]